MTNTEILLVRACKSYVPKPRLLSVHRRFYGSFSEAETEQGLIWLLAGICEKYDLIGVQALSQSIPLYDYLLEVLIYAIRFSKVDKFPTTFRHKNKWLKS
jgi:hypothetical protein